MIAGFCVILCKECSFIIIFWTLALHFFRPPSIFCTRSVLTNWLRRDEKVKNISTFFTGCKTGFAEERAPLLPSNVRDAAKLRKNNSYLFAASLSNMEKYSLDVFFFIKINKDRLALGAKFFETGKNRYSGKYRETD